METASVTNVEWHQRQIHKAASKDELAQAVIDIEYDAWEQMDWTKDKRQLARLSMLVDAKRKSIDGL